MAKKSGLGHGLDALMGGVAEGTVFGADRIANAVAAEETHTAENGDGAVVDARDANAPATNPASNADNAPATGGTEAPTAASIDAAAVEGAAPTGATTAFTASTAGGSGQTPQTQFPAGITADENGQLWADVALLHPNPHQPRQEFDEEKLRELADSIREHGVIEAIIVEDAGDGSFYIIAGERRTRAARMAGLERVPVQLRRYSEQKKLEIALIENIQRADLNAIEEAQAYYKLMELGGLNQEQVAARVGKNRSTVANAVRLLKLPEDMQAALVQGKLTAGHARALLAVTDSADQRVLFGKILGSGMSVRQAEAAATDMNAGGSADRTRNAAGTDGSAAQKNAPAADTRDPDFAALEGQFRDALGTKVVIKGSMERGTLVIDYFSRADLDRLYNIFIK